MRYVIGFFASLGILAMVTVTIAIGGLYWFAETFSEPDDLPTSIILKVRLTGAVSEVSDGSPLAGLMPDRGRLSLFDMVSALDAAAKDERVQGLVMDLSRGGLGLAEAQEFRAAVLKLRSAGKFAHAFADSFEGQDSSASYYLATAFETVSLQPSGLFDVRGLSITTPLLGGLLDEQGVRVDLQARHEFKGAAAPLTEKSLPEPIRANYQRAVTSMFEQLVAGIATGRNLSPSAVRTMIDTAPLGANEARRNNLIDKLAYWDETKSMADAAVPDSSLVTLRRYFEDKEVKELDMADEDQAKIAVIAVEGEIIRGDGGSLRNRDKAAAGKLIHAIREARRDKSVKAILIRIDSPGGSYVASDSMLRALEQARSDDRPVVVSMSNVAASGGYFISLAADHVVAQPATITGSIGVVGGKVSFGDLLSRHGVEFTAVDAGANASMYSPFRPFDDPQRGKLATILDGIYTDFTAKVSKRRRLTPDELDAVARGRVWTGEDAHRLGLVDVLGGFEEAISLARQSAGIGLDEPTVLTVFPRRPSPIDQLFDAIEGGDLIALYSGLDDLIRLVGYAEQVTEAMPGIETGDGARLRAPAMIVR